MRTTNYFSNCTLITLVITDEKVSINLITLVTNLELNDREKKPYCLSNGNNKQNNLPYYLSNRNCTKKTNLITLSQ